MSSKKAERWYEPPQPIPEFKPRPKPEPVPTPPSQPSESKPAIEHPSAKRAHHRITKELNMSSKKNVTQKQEVRRRAVAEKWYEPPQPIPEFKPRPKPESVSTQPSQPQETRAAKEPFAKYNPPDPIPEFKPRPKPESVPTPPSQPAESQLTSASD